MIVEPNGTWYLADFNWNGSTASVQKISASGTLLWEREGFADLYMSIERDHSGDIVVMDGSTLTVLDENGNTLRTLSIPGWVLAKERTALGPQNEVYLANLYSQILRSYDSLGNLRWERTLPDGVETVACDGYIVFVTTRTSALWLDRSGNTLKQVALQGVPFGPSSLDGLGNLWVMHYTLLYRLRQNPGIAAVFPADSSVQFAVGQNSDFFTSKLVGNYPNWQLRVTRYRNGIDHDTAQLVRGRTTENSRFAMMHSGDGYWSIAPGPVLSNQQAPVSMIVKHTAPPENPTQMGVILESRASVNGVKQSVEVYNFSNSTWTSLESNVALPSGGSPDRYAILPIPTPVNYIGPGREIRLRVEYRVDTPVLAWPWTARIDREMIRYVK